MLILINRNSFCFSNFTKHVIITFLSIPSLQHWKLAESFVKKFSKGVAMSSRLIYGFTRPLIPQGSIAKGIYILLKCFMQTLFKERQNILHAFASRSLLEEVECKNKSTCNPITTRNFFYIVYFSLNFFNSLACYNGYGKLNFIWYYCSVSDREIIYLVKKYFNLKNVTKIEK